MTHQSHQVMLGFFTKKTSNDAVSYNLEVDISANSGSSSRAATITLTQATTGKVITITITQKAVDIPMYVEIWVGMIRTL